MAKNVLEWLENAATTYGEKIVYLDLNQEISFQDVLSYAKSIGSALAQDEALQNSVPIAVIMGRQILTPVAYLGVVYSGHAYAPIDGKLPAARIGKILDTLQPKVIVTDDENQELAEGFARDRQMKVLNIKKLMEHTVEETCLGSIRRRMVSTDPLYMIFTSGSTGNPKGVITSHESLMHYICAYTGVMGIEEKDRLGNQSPLDYIAAVRDIYIPLLCKCSTIILPKEYFMEPDQLFHCMNQYQVTSVGWSVSAFTILSSLGAFEGQTLTTLSKICFSGSVMPGKCLKKWQEHLPEAKFVNQYGPTEATASCTYYEVDHPVTEEEVLPIGVPYDNYKVFLLDEKDQEAKPGEKGEICVSGPILALGYYNDPERTALAFVQNPLNPYYQERIYRTGDIGRMREDGMLEFHGRKDRQIKHMGHRVELDEIELAASQREDVSECCCIYNKQKEVLILFYKGEVSVRELSLYLRTTLPGFMVPRKMKCVEEIPRLPNGKVDLKTLEAWK